MYNVAYIGNFGKISEIICLKENFNLKFIVAENGTLNPEILTHSFLRDVPIHEVNDINNINHDLFRDIDFAIMCSFGQIISQNLLGVVDIYNLHFGILPNYKGRHPTFYSTLNSEPYQGLTLHKVIEEIDEGDIISIKKYPYYYWLNEEDIFRKNVSFVDELLSDLESFISNDKSIIKKDDDGKYYPPVKDSQKYINEYESARDILNLVRVQSKYGGAKLSSSGKEYRVSSAFVDEIENIEGGYKIMDTIISNEDGPLGVRINKKYYIRFKGLKHAE